MKVAFYLRMGSENQIEREPNMLEILQDIQQYCKSKGWINTSTLVTLAIPVKALVLL